MSDALRFEVPTALQYFASLVAEDEGFALLEAAIALAQDEYPQLDPQGVLAQVDALAERLKRRIPADAAVLQKLRVFTRRMQMSWQRFHLPASGLTAHR